MNYPIQENELRDYYHAYTGEEPKKEVRNLLNAVTGVLNQAYIEGQQNKTNELNMK